MGSRSIIYITIITLLSLMGIVYGSWSNGLDLNTKMKTGYIERRINIEDLDDDRLEYRLSNDGRILNITGIVYPDYRDKIAIRIEDNGSIPTVLNRIDKLNTAEIINLMEQGNSGYNRNSLKDKDLVDKFELSIDTKQVNDSILFENISNFSIDEEKHSIESNINKVQQEIYYIKDEIDRLNKLEEKYDFKYKFKYKQGL